MGNYKDMFADLASFEPAEVIRQMQEKQKEEESKILGEEQTMPAAEAVPAAQEEKATDKGKRRKDKPSFQTSRQVRITLTQSEIIKLHYLLLLPNTPIRKCMHEAVSSCIKEQYDKNKKQLKEMLNQTQDL